MNDEYYPNIFSDVIETGSMQKVVFLASLTFKVVVIWLGNVVLQAGEKGRGK